MKVLLVYPPVLEDRVHEEDISVVPMGLYYVGALLMENHHEVRLVNGPALLLAAGFLCLAGSPSFFCARADFSVTGLLAL